MASLTKRRIKSKKYQGTITSRIYYITWYENGKKKFHSTGKVRRDDAEIIFREWKEKKSNRTDRNVYLSELIPEVLKYAENNFQPGTVRIYKSTLKMFLSVVKDKPLKLYNLQDTEFYKSIRKEIVSATTINIELRTIKAAFNIAVNFDYLQFNPLAKIKQIDIDEKEIKTFSNEQIKLLFANIKTESLLKAVCIGFYTGCRLNEIINLKYENIVNDILKIRNSKSFRTKTGGIRDIPVASELKKILFPGNIKSLPDLYLLGKKYSKNYITRKFKFYLRKLNLPESLTFHCLRHTFATNLVQSNVPLIVVKELLGHSSLKTTEIYLHPGNESKINAVNKLNMR